MRRAILLLAIITLAAFPLRARLGETEPETIARYGPATGAYDAGTVGYPYRTLTFSHAGYTIIAQFIGDTCAMVCFQNSTAAR